MALCLNKSIENELRALPGNNICCDCDGKLPQWASVSFGIFMCLECSGRHRSLGVHISFVRSVSMDSWSEKQIQMMRLGGNNKCIQFLKQHGVSKETQIPQKYNSPAALLYRDRMSAEVEGRPLPTELPAVQPGGAHGADQSTEPLAGESEAQYVARQRKLQEEARERMRQKFGASNGLTSGGKMAGIGSNANYNPDQQTQSSLDLNGAYSLFSTSIALLGETVSKTAETYSSNNNSNGTPAPNKTWSMLSTGAADLWKSASVATSDIVGIITAPPDEEAEMRFPRPPMAPTGYQSNTSNSSNNSGGNTNNGNSNKVNTSSSSNRSNSSRSKPPSGKQSGAGMVSSESWDDLDDLLDAATVNGGDDQSENGKKEFNYKASSNSQRNNGNGHRQTNMSGSNNVTNETNHYVAETYREANRDYLQHSGSAGTPDKTGAAVSGMKLGNHAPTITSSRTNLSSSHNSVDSLPDSGKSNSGRAAPSGKVSAPSPVGDDFFATFGI